MTESLSQLKMGNPDVEHYYGDPLTIADAVPLEEEPKDVGAKHCKTARDLDLYYFSRDYQSVGGGHKDLQKETGLDIGVGGVSESYYD